MFGVFGLVLKLGMQHEAARIPIHCIQIEFILIGRFKLHKILLFMKCCGELILLKKFKGNPNIMTGRRHFYLELENIKNKYINQVYIPLCYIA